MIDQKRKKFLGVVEELTFLICEYQGIKQYNILKKKVGK